jgi:phage baseplate assembly protein W
MPKDYVYEYLREINPTNEEETLGAGFAFPLEVTTGGNVKVTIGETNVKSAIFHIAAYRRGDLYGTPSFGGNVPMMVFTVFSGDKLKLHEEWLQSSIEAWEPRVTDLRVTAGKDTKGNDNKVVLLTQYRVEGVDTDTYTVLPAD